MQNGTAVLNPPPSASKPALDLDRLEPGVPLHLTNVSWDDYERFLEIIGDRPIRTSFSDGEFEIVMPTFVHGLWISLLARLLQTLADELEMDIRSLDPVTMRRPNLRKGLEADRWFYLTNEPSMRCKTTLNLETDPPPDVAIEAEYTSTLGRRMQIYAALGVPEAWRYRDERLAVHQLQENEEYLVVERSQFFPMIPVREIERFMHLSSQMAERVLIKSFRDWVRQQIAAGWTNSK